MINRIALMALAAGFACLPALADEKKVTFDALFEALKTGGCIKIEAVRETGAVVELNADQFQFVRAFWMAIPPLSHDLPPGDKAFIAKDQTGAVAVGLFVSETGDVCATFEATDWLKAILDQVGKGEVGKRGDPT